MDGNFEAKAPDNSSIVRFRPNQTQQIVYLEVPAQDNSGQVTYERIYFYVNPNSISFSFRQKVNRRKSRAGWIDEYWGEELDTLSVEAFSGGFRSNTTGYSSYISAQSDSTAFQRLEKIVQAYRQNGLLFSSAKDFAEDFIPIKFHYDKFVYHGFFETFNMEDTADRPFMLSFSFTFKVLGTDAAF